MKKNRIWSIVGLLFLLYCSSAGNYINSGDDYLADNNTWLALIDLAICSFCLMIVPFIWRLINKKRFDIKKGKAICRWNSIIAFIISSILMAATDIGFVGGLGALIYYFINKWIFVDEKTNSENIDKPLEEVVEESVPTAIEDNTIEIVEEIQNRKEVETEEIKKIATPKYCSECGIKLEKGWQFCNNCGVKIIK